MDSKTESRVGEDLLYPDPFNNGNQDHGTRVPKLRPIQEPKWVPP